VLLKNITIIHEDRIDKSVDIRINGISGLIENIASEIDSKNEEKILDCSNLWMFPGLIEIHAHLRDFGQSYKEDYTTATKAALAGGYTTVFDMPNKIPPVNNIEMYNKVLKKIEHINMIDIYQYIMITNNLFELNDFWIYGKIYLGAGSTAASGQEYNIIEKTHRFMNKFISIHAEDGKIISKNSKKYTDPVFDHNKIRSPAAELTAIKKVLEILETKSLTNNKYHFAHISLPESINLIKNYNLKNVSFEAAPHHLFLSEDDLNNLKVFGKVNPPLRSKKDMLGLRALWEKGEIPIIASDHAPHTIEEKEKLKVSGIPSLDTNLRLLLDHCLKNSISPTLITKTCSTNTAKLMGIFESKGSIEIGKKADLVLVDPEKEEPISKEMLETKAKWTPWGKKLLSVPIVTFKDARIVWSNPKHFGSVIKN
jgi:dihydroorotase